VLARWFPRRGMPNRMPPCAVWSAWWFSASDGCGVSLDQRPAAASPSASARPTGRAAGGASGRADGDGGRLGLPAAV